MSNEPWLGDLEGDLSGESEWVQIQGIRWRFLGNFSVGPRLGDLEVCLIRNYG